MPPAPQADGKANALRTKGEAEAAYHVNVAASLTPTLIQRQYFERWKRLTSAASYSSFPAEYRSKI
jgi:hypothetical protein